MKKILPALRGCIARNKKLNEVITELNPLLNIKVNKGAESLPSVNYSMNNVVITLPKQESGLPSGYSEELFDVVLTNNTAGQRYLLSKSV